MAIVLPVGGAGLNACGAVAGAAGAAGAGTAGAAGCCGACGACGAGAGAGAAAAGACGAADTAGAVWVGAEPQANAAINTNIEPNTRTNGMRRIISPIASPLKSVFPNSFVHAKYITAVLKVNLMAFGNHLYRNLAPSRGRENCLST
ncbi:MAG: hypothetical protein F4Y44_02495 [Chloroflexi bacterium]|nr:hypothetical protein [Chloroflexota bacterium]